MNIISIEAGPVQTNTYIVYDDISRDAVVIDVPPDSSEIILSKIKELGLNVRAVLLTHTHWDHSAEVPKLKRAVDAPVYLHKADEYRVLQPEKHTVFNLPFKLEPFSADKYFEDGQELVFGTLECRILHTPGHTEGGVCIYFPNDNVIFTGDTLFNMSVGRVDLPGGDWETLYNSIYNKLLVLPDDIDVYCGHNEPTTIGFERRNNPFLNNNNIY